MDAFQVEVLTRIDALQHVVTQIGKIVCLNTELPPKRLEVMALLDEMGSLLSGDPEMPDHVASETRKHVKSIIAAIADGVAEMRGEKEQESGS